MRNEQAQHVEHLKVEGHFPSQVQPKDHPNLIREIGCIVQVVVVEENSLTILPVVDFSLFDEGWVALGIVFGVRIDAEVARVILVVVPGSIRQGGSAGSPCSSPNVG